MTVNVLRDRRSAVAVFILVAVGPVTFAFTRGLDFLTGGALIFIAVQAVAAINFHLFAPRSTEGGAIKSNEPFRFRAVEVAVISAVFGLAGVASLTGILAAGNLAGWLALCAGIAGGANVVATRHRCAPTGFDKPS